MSYLSFLINNAPQVVLAFASVLVLFTDFALVRRKPLTTRSLISSVIACIGCFAAILWIAHPPSFLIHGELLSRSFEHPLHLGLLAVTVGVLLLGCANTFTEHPAEFNFLVLLATIGMMFLVDASDLITFFLSLELLSLCLYTLTAFNKSNTRSAEAALKYFLFGGISAAFLLFGFSFFYGTCGSIDFRDIFGTTASDALRPFFLLGVICTVVGFCFKVAAAPFHFWAPDAYEGAPAPAAALIASASKIASFAAFFPMLHWVLGNANHGAIRTPFPANGVLLFSSIAVLSMLFGNLVALRQTGLRRLVAYSAIAHAGYMLLSITTASSQAAASLTYYVITYAIGTVGVFAIIAALETSDGSDALTHVNGLYRRSPILATCLFLFILSLAGIPPLSGFFAKFYVFLAVLQTPGHLWLVVLALATSAIALYYYLQILKRAFLLPAEAHAPALKPHVAHIAVAVLTAAAVTLLGLFPNVFLHWINAGRLR